MNMTLLSHRPASTEAEKGQQIENVQAYQAARNSYSAEGLRGLRSTARERRNGFESLMEAVKTHSMGQISHALYDVANTGATCD